MKQLIQSPPPADVQLPREIDVPSCSPPLESDVQLVVLLGMNVPLQQEGQSHWGGGFFVGTMTAAEDESVAVDTIVATRVGRTITAGV